MLIHAKSGECTLIVAVDDFLVHRSPAIHVLVSVLSESTLLDTMSPQE
jgi:hypothetical protein